MLDPNSKADNFATDAFDGVNLYATAIVSYQHCGLAGSIFNTAFNWSNKPKDQFDITLRSTDVAGGRSNNPWGVLVGSPIDRVICRSIIRVPELGLWSRIYSQFLSDGEPAEIAAKIKSGQPINGIGVFARAGYAPPETNPVTSDGSVALVAHGLFDIRKYDSFGACLLLQCD